MRKNQMESSKNVLYISYTGMLEPLGQSQVLNYLEKLSEKHLISLLSFEKPEDLKDTAEVNRIRRICETNNIRWTYKKYHRSPRLAATILDLALMVSEARKEIKNQNTDLIHSRGYIPAFAALLVKKLYGIPFVFDMRAFWPDEMVTAGRLQERGWLYKRLKKLEKKCLRESAHTVVLTEAAKDYLVKSENKDGLINISSIPTCVDLNLFTMPRKTTSQTKGRKFIAGSVGTVSGWFKIDWLFSFFKALKEKEPQSTLRIVSRENKSFIKERATENRIELSEVEIKSCNYRDVPKEMQKMDVAVFFFEPGFSKLGSSPTRMAEFLACGIPCVANSGVGDVEEIINTYHVGVVIDQPGESVMQMAVEEILVLLKDENTPKRCRKAAEEYFSITNAVEKYSEIYQSSSR